MDLQRRVDELNNELQVAHSDAQRMQAELARLRVSVGELQERSDALARENKQLSGEFTQLTANLRYWRNFFTRYCIAGVNKRLRSASLYHSRQCCARVVLKPRSDPIDYTVRRLLYDDARLQPKVVKTVGYQCELSVV